MQGACVGMSVCTYDVYKPVGMHAWMQVCVYIYIYAYVYIYVCVCVSISLCMHMYVCMYIRRYVCM